MKKSVFSARFIAEAGIIAALYFVLTIAFSFMSFGQLQVRVSEALCILPFFTPAAVPGLFVGCLLANLAGTPLGPYDILFGSLATLAAAVIARFIKNKWFLPLPAVLINAFVVAGVLNHYLHLLYWESVLWVAAGQIAACYVLGIPLFIALSRHKDKLFIRR